MNFTSLRAALLGFANESIEPDFSDPMLMPIRHQLGGQGFNLHYHGKTPANYGILIYPDTTHPNYEVISHGSNVGYMQLQVMKYVDEITSLMFRVCSNQGKVYEYTFYFLEGMPNVDMRIGRGANVTGERVSWSTVRCIDLVIFDLIELMLPPQIIAHMPGHNPHYGRCGTEHPCFVCGTKVPWNWETCTGCFNNEPLLVTATVS